MFYKFPCINVMFPSTFLLKSLITDVTKQTIPSEICANMKVFFFFLISVLNCFLINWSLLDNGTFNNNLTKQLILSSEVAFGKPLTLKSVEIIRA